MEHRATRGVIEGRRRARYVATRLGIGLREARVSARLSQAELSRRSGLAQTRISALERGLGAGSSLETWSVLGAVLGRDLAAFWDRASGTTLPRDTEHLRRQELIVRFSAVGGWSAVAEEAVEVGLDRRRFVDVALVRATTGEVCVVEVWDLLTDVGEAMRGLEVKLSAMRRREAEIGRAVSGLWVVRGTRRNRRLVREFRAVFGSKFRGESKTWLASLRDPAVEMPRASGLVWTDVRGLRLYPSRIERMGGPLATPPAVGVLGGREIRPARDPAVSDLRAYLPES